MFLNIFYDIKWAVGGANKRLTALKDENRPQIAIKACTFEPGLESGDCCSMG